MIGTLLVEGAWNAMERDSSRTGRLDTLRTRASSRERVLVASDVCAVKPGKSQYSIDSMRCSCARSEIFVRTFSAARREDEPVDVDGAFNDCMAMDAVEWCDDGDTPGPVSRQAAH